VSHLSPGEVWKIDCPGCKAHTHVRFDFCELIEYVDNEPVTYAIRWMCPRCIGKFSMFIAVDSARLALEHGARHSAIHAPIEKHDGGKIIDENDQIDFALAWETGKDETQDAVWDRIWLELIGSTESKEDP